jgi:sugar lactone lactonase YvrE
MARASKCALRYIKASVLGAERNLVLRIVTSRSCQSAKASLLTMLLLAGCARADAIRSPSEPREGATSAVTIQHPALYPETIVHDRARDAFLVGSVREGAVYRVQADGSAHVLIEDERLISVLGIALDERRDRLWVTNSDIGAGVRTSAQGSRSVAAVAVYELSTGRAIHYIDLTGLHRGPHLINGIALDRDGQAYVTDSFSPVIYKVDGEGRASLLVQDARFEGEAINLNGIVVHPEGYLLVIKKSDGALFKVSLGSPRDISRVATAEALEGGDGLLLASARDLLVVSNRTPSAKANALVALQSVDGWVSATVKRRAALGDVYPTTATVRDGRLLVLHSKLNALLQAPAAAKSSLRESAMIEDVGTTMDFDGRAR